MRDIDMTLADIERQLPGRLCAQTGMHRGGALGGQHVRDVYTALLPEDLGDDAAIESRIQLQLHRLAYFQPPGASGSPEQPRFYTVVG